MLEMVRTYIKAGYRCNSSWFYRLSSVVGTVSFWVSSPHPQPHPTPQPPPTSVLQVDQPAARPAVCWCRRFKQRGLISISVCVNTLITHLSNEAAVSQPFSCAGIMVRVFVCVCGGGGMWETRVAYDKSVGMAYAIQRKEEEIGKWPHTDFVSRELLDPCSVWYLHKPSINKFTVF